MTTYPNQKVVTVHKNKGSADQPFLQLINSEWQQAAKELTGVEFKLYIYIAANADGFEFALSRKDVMNCTGISEIAYENGIKSLIKKGYLFHTHGNNFDFNSSPKKYGIEDSDLPLKVWDEPLESMGLSPKKYGDTPLKSMEEIHNIHNIYKTHMCNDDISLEGILVEKSTLTSKPTPSGDFQSQINSWMRESRKNRT